MMKSSLLFLFLIPCLFGRGQQTDQKEVEETIDKFLHFLSFSDTSSVQIDSLPSLFTNDGKLVANFGKKPMVFTAPLFVESIRKNIRSGVLYSSLERELAREVDIFGKIAHVLSTYELTMIGKEGTIVRRGLNSIQLLKQDGKWLIYSLVWDRESNELKLPAKYLP